MKSDDAVRSASVNKLKLTLVDGKYLLLGLYYN